MTSPTTRVLEAIRARLAAPSSTTLVAYRERLFQADLAKLLAIVERQKTALTSIANHRNLDCVTAALAISDCDAIAKGSE